MNVENYDKVFSKESFEMNVENYNKVFSSISLELVFSKLRKYACILMIKYA